MKTGDNYFLPTASSVILTRLSFVPVSRSEPVMLRGRALSGRPVRYDSWALQVGAERLVLLHRSEDYL